MNIVIIKIYHNLFGLYVGMVTMVIALNIQYMSFTLIISSKIFSWTVSRFEIGFYIPRMMETFADRLPIQKFTHKNPNSDTDTRIFQILHY